MAETKEIAEGMKRCSQCGEVKPATAESFFRQTQNRDGLTRDCKVCRNKYYEANKEKIRKQQKVYSEANKEKIAEKDKKYQEANKEKIAEKGKKYYEANKEKIRERQKDYHEANKEKWKKAYDEKYSD